MPTPLKRFLRITPQQLRAFEATSRLLSITQAAKELHVTQPTISVQLRELAEKVGQPLFETGAAGMRLTEVGDMLVQTEAAIGNCWLNFEIRLAEMHTAKRPSLRICAETGAEYFLPQWMRQFELAFPQVDLQFTMAARDSALQKLAAGGCDFILVAGERTDSLLLQAAVHTSRHVVIASAQHPLANGKGCITLDALRSERWLLLEHLAYPMGLQAVTHMTFVSYEAICRAVASGLGVAMVPVEMLAGQPALMGGSAGPAAVAQLEVEGFPWEQHWSLVARGDRPSTPAVRSFAELVDSIVKGCKGL